MIIARAFRLLTCLSLLTFIVSNWQLEAQESEDSEKVARELLAKAISTDDQDEQFLVIGQLAETGEKIVLDVFEQWKVGEIFLYEEPGTAHVTPVILKDPASADPQEAISVMTGEPVTSADGSPLKLVASDLTVADTSRKLRKEMKNTADLLELASKDPEVRAQIAVKLGQMQDPNVLPYLEKRLAKEKVGKVKKSLKEGIAITKLASDSDEEVIAAAKALADVHSVSGRDSLQGLLREYEEKPEGQRNEEVLQALKKANISIDNYLKLVDTFGTAFRGLSLGSVLLIVALGLAITFGLMGVINMAHGEMIAIGAYATYLTERLFTSMFGTDGLGFELYFIFAIPIAFIVAALMGLILERSVIQFLYKRPLESLLATWGVSLVIQQGFRLIFGAANRQVNSPRWLMGSFEVSDVTLGYNRLFVILFAILIVFGTWLLMTKTPMGLCIRSVMQNPQMAACMGIRTNRVRMMTFAFGSGLAGLAGAFLSQIGNVGPALGQSYIVDSFMVVVAGGAGNLIGTVASALGIGVTDQMLQPFLGPVMGKVCVLIAIILFLQWRPGGLFPTKSRALD